MRPTSRKPAARKSNGLTDAEDGCPVPSAHDKLVEASYFLHEMIRKYHWPDEFRYSLGAFLQAARSVTDMLPKELAPRKGGREWWSSRKERLESDSDLKQMKEYRDLLVHRESLFPSSTMFVGHFEYGKRKFGMVGVPLPAQETSVHALLRSRSILQASEHPHRALEGEEFGIERSWTLKEIPNQEVVTFSASCWQKIAEIVFEAHDWQGCPFERGSISDTIKPGYQVLRESQVFPEVTKAWDSDPTEMVTSAGETLEFVESPNAHSTVLQKIDRTSTAKGWVGRQARFWPQQYRSMIIYSIDETVITKNTAVFFENPKAKVTTIHYPKPEDTNGQ